MNRDQPGRREAERPERRSNGVSGKWPWSVSLASESGAKKQQVSPSKGEEQTTATSSPLGGVSVCFRGRSSDFAGSTLLAGLPRALRLQCHLGLSYLLTAAGQLRILTGFPFDSPLGETMERLLYLGYGADASPFLVDSLQNPVQ